MVPSTELLERIKAHYPDVTRGSDEMNDTARSWCIPGHRGSFGFISSMSDHFCGTCNRLRLTADGQIKVSRPNARPDQLLHPCRCASLIPKKSHYAM